MRWPISGKSCATSKVLEGVFALQDALELLLKRRDVPLPVTELAQWPPDNLVAGHPEQPIEGNVGLLHPAFEVEDQHRLAYGGQDLVDKLALLLLALFLPQVVGGAVGHPGLLERQGDQFGAFPGRQNPSAHEPGIARGVSDLDVVEGKLLRQHVLES